jgi:hypothetical protein
VGDEIVAVAVAVNVDVNGGSIALMGQDQDRDLVQLGARGGRRSDPRISKIPDRK